MYAQTLLEKKTGRSLILFVEGYRENGKVKHRTVERIGYVDEFSHLYDDPVAHFKQVAKEKSKLVKAQRKAITVELMPEGLLPFDPDTDSYDCVKNIGHAAISKIFHTLGIHKFFDDRRKHLDISYNLTAVVKLLVYERILAPDSKRTAWLSKNKYFDKMDFDLNAVYHSLRILPRYRDDLLKLLHTHMVDLYHRDSTLLFYDMTNYYFEIDNEDSFRRKGPSKAHRKTPIVQMGLFMDSAGFPVTYDLFPGNTNDSLTFTPMSEKVRAQLEMEHLIFVADKGMMSGDNVAEAVAHHNGYIFSKSVRGGTQLLKDTVRDLNGYLRYDASGNLISVSDTETPVSFMYKVLDEVKDSEGKRHTVKGVGHYQIVYWSAKYAQRAKLDRQNAAEKAVAASHTKSRNGSDNNHGKNTYLSTHVRDKNTKEQFAACDAKVVFNSQKLEEDESLDGFYLIETNVTGLPQNVDAQAHETGELEASFDRHSRWLEKEGMLQLNRIVEPLDIVDMYHGLCKIEQTFRVTKSDLHARPIYVSREDRINAHFLTCFLALLIVRILAHELNHEFSSEQIITSLRKANVVELNSTTFKTLYYDRTLKRLKEVLGIAYGMNLYTRAGVRNLLAAAKKSKQHTT